MTSCRNPECRKGLTPGVVIIGKGNAKTPVIGQSMRWGWVRCLACNPDPEDSKHGAVYKPVTRTPEQIAQRAELATLKAPYKPESAVAKSLGSLQVNGVAAASGTSSAVAQAEQIVKLTETLSRLSVQVAELLEENRELRKQITAGSTAAAPSPNPLVKPS